MKIVVHEPVRLTLKFYYCSTKSQLWTHSYYLYLTLREQFRWICCHPLYLVFLPCKRRSLKSTYESCHTMCSQKKYIRVIEYHWFQPNISEMFIHLKHAKAKFLCQPRTMGPPLVVVNLTKTHDFVREKWPSVHLKEIVQKV